VKISGGGFTTLIIAEDPGLDPVKLTRCAAAAALRADSPG